MDRRETVKALLRHAAATLLGIVSLSHAVAADPSAAQQLAATGEAFVEGEYDFVPVRESTGQGVGPRAARAIVDLSPGWRERRLAFYRGIVARVERIAVADLTEADRINRQLLLERARDRLAAAGYPLEEIAFLNPAGGLLPTLIRAATSTQPLRSEADFETWLKRVEASAASFDLAIVAMREAAKQGWTAPRELVDKGMRQVEAMASVPAEQMPFWSVLGKYPQVLSAERRAAYEARYRTALEGKLRPALGRFAAFAREEYLPQIRATSGIGDLPRGAAAYRELVRQYTTLELAPDEVHALGLAEVARIRARMLGVAHGLGFEGGIRDFAAWHQSNPANYPFKSGEEVLTYLRGVHARVEPQVAKLFKRLPKAALEIQLVDPAIAGSSSANYSRPLPDGSRPGVFRIPVVEPRRIAAFALPSLFLHEGLPGHHLDIGRGLELEVPRFRRLQSVTVYSEGWGLYAESLGHELGVYDDPWALLGRYTAELHRAARLVVDTGLHSRGWSRERTIAYLEEETGQASSGAIAATERYMANPGQALAYKVGELEILKLRAEAEAALGSRFDIREFHEAVLGAGQLTLGLLRKRVEDWVAREKSRA